MGLQTGDVPLALTGRTNVLVSLENGPIRVGDRIVTSHAEGIGMKALHSGYVVGRALLGFDPANNVGTCTEGTAATSSSATSTCAGMIAIQLGIGYDGSIGGGFVSDIVSAVTDVTQAVTDLADGALTTAGQYTKLAVAKIVAQTAVVKDFFAQVFTILPGGKINLPAGINQIAGSGTLPSGATTFFVANSNVTQGAKIFITPRTMLATPIAVTDIAPGSGFTVSVTNPGPVDVPFDWFMVGTYDAGGGSAQSTPPLAPPPPVPLMVSSSTPSTGTASSTPPTDTASSTPTASGTGTTTTP